eukprot:m.240525 g.240525  ORF g.240525 m.240525 type:complete len:119 (+) comp15311_c0_seq7:2226-2582(+)
MLRDNVVKSRGEWERAINFMQDTLQAEFNDTELELRELKGPSLVQRWTSWQSTSPEQQAHKTLITAIENTLLQHGMTPPSRLDDEDVGSLKRLVSRAHSIDLPDGMTTCAPQFSWHSR